ncbi:ATP-grasp domain-containing protein [Heliorestis acidaminivorans]|uniref:ATP-grasp domain-containing protein n=1 Tax=Heliorestis acidaminivorans TaxID=553427 RepID=A0A6I0EZ89_9FIRM|nr:ATP-grasp domain-containing protein [Heliorestis acidaminivorans]KAB2952259.1 ATP-grasp domain-containing protein [Heliorestis acidaminivorans]
MNVLFLSPHFPPNYYQFVVALKKAGANVLGIADRPYDDLPLELREALNDYYQVPTLEDYDQLVRACGYFTHRHGKIDRLDSLTEYWLEKEAKLRTDFNVWGIQNEGIDKVKSKSRMKEMFLQAGIDVPRGRVVRNIEEARAFLKIVNFPVVLKPNSGVGAANTYKIHTRQELERFFQDKESSGNFGDYIMEEFITGTIYSFDGLTDREGQLVFYTSHRYGQGVMEVVNEDLHVYYYSLREIPDKLVAAGKKVLEAYQVRERFFHFEFFRTADDRFIALEVNMRPPGGLTMDMFNYAHDIDLYQHWARLIVEGTLPLHYTRKYHCAYIGRKNNKSYALTHEEILREYGHKIPYHCDINPAFTRAIGDYGYLFRSPHLEEIKETIDHILALKNQ